MHRARTVPPHPRTELGHPGVRSAVRKVRQGQRPVTQHLGVVPTLLQLPWLTVPAASLPQAALAVLAVLAVLATRR